MLYLELCPGAGLDPATWGHGCWQPQLPTRRWVIGVLPHTTAFLLQVPHLLLSLIQKVPALAQGLSLLHPGCAVPVPRAETLTSNLLVLPNRATAPSASPRRFLCKVTRAPNPPWHEDGNSCGLADGLQKGRGDLKP